MDGFVCTSGNGMLILQVDAIAAQFLYCYNQYYFSKDWFWADSY